LWLCTTDQPPKSGLFYGKGWSLMDKQDFKGKIVLITGAGKGSGRKLAEAFARHGATVAANDISPNNVDEVAAKINAQGGGARAYIEDVAKKVGAQALVKQVEDDFGRIDILVNHAAVEPRSPLLDMDEWDWHRVLDVNLTGAFLMTQSVGRVMREGGGGVIVNLVTEAGRDESPLRAAFFASMAGLETFSQQAACELEPYGIRVLVVKTDTDVEIILDLCRSTA
jgi:NAD(P)-dependent dehydrogenase (short-subunit alcohol dehydrogenase family)